MLAGIEETSTLTVLLIQKIKLLMQTQKQQIRSEIPKIYSQDLLNNIFRHPYTKIDFVMADLRVSRKTAIRYLDELVRIGILNKQKIWKDNYYLNDDLIFLLSSVNSAS